MDNMIQKDLLKLLRSFDAICREHGIEYTLHGGNLLGAVRNQGFIPWDDDADVSMTREDFIRLKEVLSNHDTGFVFKGSVKTQIYPADHNDIWIDIFICDYISENTILQKVKLNLLTILDIMSKTTKSRKLSSTSSYSLPKQIAFYLLYILGRIVPKSWKSRCYTAVSQNMFIGNRSMMFRSNDHYVGRSKVFPANWMSRYQDILFENQQLSVVEEYDKLLTSLYGKDYLTPVHDDHITEVHTLVRSAEGALW